VLVHGVAKPQGGGARRRGRRLRLRPAVPAVPAAHEEGDDEEGDEDEGERGATHNAGQGTLNPMVREPLQDGHGRDIGDVRVSVTDRCNFRCQYCMPAEGLPWLERSEILTFEEITRLVGLLAEMGVSAVRLTGGEPLVRRELPRLVAMLDAVPGLDDLALTTNGYLLDRDAAALVAAGVKRFNVSIDSLQRDRFFAMTRRDALPRVLRGLEVLAAQRGPDGPPRIKVNAVALRGFTEEEALPFAAWARETGWEVRFIEWMPLDADHAWTADQVLPGEELRALINARWPLEPEAREPSATARTWRFADGARGRIGFVNPVSEPFCSDCDRIRLTADGRLRTCLFSLNETDLRGPLREGASDDELEELVRGAVWRKELKHRVGDPGFVQPARSMSAIGG
jgi:cyclic pyranopterin phosphate synthase